MIFFFEGNIHYHLLFIDDFGYKNMIWRNRTISKMVMKSSDITGIVLIIFTIFLLIKTVIPNRDQIV